MLIKTAAVSYTHLDVYKRQVCAATIYQPGKSDGTSHSNGPGAVSYTHLTRESCALRIVTRPNTRVKHIFKGKEIFEGICKMFRNKKRSPRASFLWIILLRFSHWPTVFFLDGCSKAG